MVQAERDDLKGSEVLRVLKVLKVPEGSEGSDGSDGSDGECLETGVKKKLNIVQICDHLGWTGSRMHGVKRLFAWMIPRFDRQRFNVSLISLRKKDTSGDTLERLGIDVTYLHKSKFDPATLPALLKELDRRQADVLHLHGYGATTFGRLAAARRGWPAIVHEHANLTDTPWFQKIADRALARYTDLAIAVSQSTAAFVINARLIPAERTRVVYLGVPLEEFSRERSAGEVRAARAAIGITDGTPAIGTVTRLMPSKGNEFLVAAAPQVLEAVPRARFFVAGEGELQAPLEARAAALGLGDRFVFLGFQRDVAAILSALDIVVFPSLWEGTPLTAFEALAMGKPIVATDADGLAEILTDGVDARIVPRRNAAALAGGVVDLLGDPAARAALAARARRTGARYDIDVFVRKMERLYELLHETSRATRRTGVLSADLSFLGGTAS
jgi:glycosyltransferase involved in cell wall biosynthesis